MSKNERFDEIEIEGDVLGWIVTSWDNIENKEKILPVSYGNLVDFAADQYFDGDKSTAFNWLKNIDWLSMKDEIILLFKEKMKDVGSNETNRAF